MAHQCRVVVLNDNGCPTRIANFEVIPDPGDIVMVSRVDGMSAAACVVRRKMFYGRSFILLVEWEDEAEEQAFRAIDLLIRDNVSGDQL